MFVSIILHDDMSLTFYNIDSTRGREFNKIKIKHRLKCGPFFYTKNNQI